MHASPSDSTTKHAKITKGPHPGLTTLGVAGWPNGHVRISDTTVAALAVSPWCALWSIFGSLAKPFTTRHSLRFRPSAATANRRITFDTSNNSRSRRRWKFNLGVIARVTVILGWSGW